MIGGVKEAHIKKFSRLVQELYDLLRTIRKYNPNVCYRLLNCESMSIGLNSNEDDDYPTILSEMLECDSINDVGTAVYDIDEEASERCSYIKHSRNKLNRSHGSNRTKRQIKIGSEDYYEDVVPFYNGYKNSFIFDFDEPLSEKEFASIHLGIELVD